MANWQSDRENYASAVRIDPLFQAVERLNGNSANWMEKVSDEQ
jgi:hypothetical protein